MRYRYGSEFVKALNSFHPLTLNKRVSQNFRVFSSNIVFNDKYNRDKNPKGLLRPAVFSNRLTENCNVILRRKSLFLHTSSALQNRIRMVDNVVDGNKLCFPDEEQKILQYWDDIDAFKEQLRRTEGKPEYIFYDGPPFATGLPHYGHILAGTLKDIVTRYASSCGRHVTRRFGWDCHGLPVEYEIDKKLGIKSREDVFKLGIANYNEECRSIVMRYSKEWEKTVKRLGRWIDFQNDYKTLDPSFMESVWWVFKQLFEKGLVYQGFKVMPFSTACSTPLSNFEAGQNYKDVSDPAVMISFPVIGDKDNASLVAWTTTPWTLPSNVALCVNPTMTYVWVRDNKKNRVYIVAESRLPFIPGAVPKPTKGGKGGKANKDAEAEEGFEILFRKPGSELVGLQYEPLFPYFKHITTAFRVVSDGYVTDDSGTGIVHQAPAFGEDDYRVCLANNIFEKGEGIPCPVDFNGCFTEQVPDFKGVHVKEADKDIIVKIKEMGRLIDNGSITHPYPFCWRSDTPLIYRAVPSWFVKVEEIKDRLLKNNAQTYWVPNFVKEKRFHNWLENAHDWAISRSRFWGTPIPIWISEDGEEIVCVGSVEELERLTGTKVTDLHRHFIDHLTIPSQKGKGDLRRVDDVFDCWFESGSMPYGQLHYPFENKELFENNFPADFIAEGLDQTRGWFYTLMVLSTALFDKPAFQNLVCNGLVLAADGKKMSKRLKNYPDPTEVIDKYGADALRLYLINSPVVRAETLRFREEGVQGVVKDVFVPWYSAYRFLIQNIIRYETQTKTKFDPNVVDLSKATNVLDRWIAAAGRNLTNYVGQEMDGYRLYTVVPFLIKFIEDLTNVYVRLNRDRLKGRGAAGAADEELEGGGVEGAAALTTEEDAASAAADEDRLMALVSLYNVLLNTCQVMSPFTPFLTELMYLNLRHCQPEKLPESVHFCDFPARVTEQEGDRRIQESVHRMQRVIDLGRAIRTRNNVALKMPLSNLTIVHTDAEFLADIQSELRSYVETELNVHELTVCSDPLKFSNVRAEPDWQALGKKLGKSMNVVSKAIKGLTAEDILAFEKEGSIELEGFVIDRSEIKVLRDFCLPDGLTKEQMDADGDGELLVVMDLRLNDELLLEGSARELINRFQKLRKTTGITFGKEDPIYYRVQDGSDDAERLAKVLMAHAALLKERLGSVMRDAKELEKEEEKQFKQVAEEKQTINLGKDTIVFDAILCQKL